MSEVWAFVASPWGLLAYAAFWAFKLTLGMWALRRATALLPVRVRSRLAERPLMRRRRLP
ncbi:hypothetical protein [Pseudoponticoccus marisrubri]|uniref:Uncharacterized protein n=1 Tax=Pseudoponticoccus marisrubri TaxID=1685382 RepID=A0A0W7WEL3_9RHOB|nr:hypothetical protein [Pseudoponticoccus marisrubri]KUF09073.1 hypothetical protein AVJ23_19290 [Pseudoponticoccus marisrubri]